MSLKSWELGSYLSFLFERKFCVHFTFTRCTCTLLNSVKSIFFKKKKLFFNNYICVYIYTDIFNNKAVSWQGIFRELAHSYLWPPFAGFSSSSSFFQVSSFLILFLVSIQPFFISNSRKDGIFVLVC